MSEVASRQIGLEIRRGPLGAQSNSVQVSPTLPTLSSVIEQIGELRSTSSAEDKLLDLICDKLKLKESSSERKPEWEFCSFQEEITSHCSLTHGFAVGLAEGTVFVVVPPCSGNVSLSPEDQLPDHRSAELIGQSSVSSPPAGQRAKAVIVLVQLGADLLAFTASQGYYISLLNLQSHCFTLPPQNDEFTAAAVRQSSEEVLVGFKSGNVQLRTPAQGQHRDYDLTTLFPAELQNDYAVEKIYATCAEPWFAVRYNNHSDRVLIVWKLENATKLYQFHSTSAEKVPMTVLPHSESQFPDYDSFLFDPACITYLDACSKWVDKRYFRLMLHGGVIWDVQTSLSKLDFLELKARATNLATFRIRDFCVFLLPMEDYDWINEELNGDEKSQDSVMQLKSDFDYKNYLVSEDGLYLCLIGKQTMKVVTICAIEAGYTHAFCVRSMSTGLNLYSSFGSFFDEQGRKFPDAEKASKHLEFKEDNEVYGIQDSGGLSLFKSSEKKALFSPVTEVKQWVKSNGAIVLVCENKVKICDLLGESPCSLVEYRINWVKPHSVYFWKASIGLVAFTVKENGYLYSFAGTQVANYTELFPTNAHEGFEKVIEIDSGTTDFLLAYPSSVVHFSEKSPQFTSISKTFNDLKPFAKGQFCAAYSELESLTTVLSLPQLRELLQFRWSDCLLVNKQEDKLWSYCADPEDEKFGVVKCWDLGLGIYTKTIDTGLKACVEMIGQMPGSVFQPLKSTDSRIEYQSESSQIIYKQWKFDLSERNGTHLVDLKGLKFIGTESLAAYCCSLKRLISILCAKKRTEIILDSYVCRIVIYPYGINLLHFLVELEYDKLILPAFHLSVKFLKSAFGTPVSLCFAKSPPKTRCLDALLQGLVELRQRDPEEFLAALHQMSDRGEAGKEDFEAVISAQSRGLKEFLRSVMVPLPTEVLPVSTTLSACCPCFTFLQPNLRHPNQQQTCLCSSVFQPFHTVNEYHLTAQICPIGLHLSMDSPKGQKLLLALRDSDPYILTQQVVLTLADLKWKKVQPILILLSVVYWILLVLVVCRVYGYGEQIYVGAAVIALNLVLCAIEFAQMCRNCKEYVKDVWNLVDVVRIVFTFPFAVISVRVWLNFLVVSVSAIRGLTSFESINSMRFLVKMVLKACSETVIFVVVFIYSNMCFGVLLKVSEEDAEEVNFFESWRESFELSMGGFDNSESNSLRWMVFFAACLVNVIWMLNLLISILGTAYEDFTAQLKAEDVKNQFRLIAEIERITTFLEPVSKPQYLFTFDTNAEGEHSRNEQVTLFSLHEELQNRDIALSERLDRMEKELEKKFVEKLDQLLQAVKVAGVTQLSEMKELKQGREGVKTDEVE